MSHHSGLSLVALHKEDISAYFGKALATRLIGDEAQSLPEGKPQYPTI